MFKKENKPQTEVETNGDKGNTDTNGAEDETVLMIMNALSREHLLDAFVSQVRDLYDYILIDCSPSLNLVTINVLTAVDSVIIPVEASYLSMAGLQQLLGSIGSTKWKKYVKTGFMAKLISPALIGFTQSVFQSSHDQLSESSDPFIRTFFSHFDIVLNLFFIFVTE